MMHGLSVSCAKVMFFITLALTLLMLWMPATEILIFKNWVANWLPGARWIDQSDITSQGDTWTHALLFMILGWLAMRGWRVRHQRQYLTFLLLAIAITTEIVQTWIPGRGPNVADFVADALGLAAGAILGWRGLARCAPFGHPAPKRHRAPHACRNRRPAPKQARYRRLCANGLPRSGVVAGAMQAGRWVKTGARPRNTGGSSYRI